MDGISKKIYLELQAPTEDDNRSDQRRIQDGLKEQGIEAKVSLRVLRKLYPLCEEAEWKVTVSLAWDGQTWHGVDLDKMHITERRLVCSKHPVYSVALAYGFPCGIPVCLMIKLVPFHHQIYDFHSVFGKNRLKNGMSVIGSNIRSHSGNMKDFPALVFNDNLCGSPASVNVVGTYHGNLRSEILIQRHDCPLSF